MLVEYYGELGEHIVGVELTEYVTDWVYEPHQVTQAFARLINVLAETGRLDRDGIESVVEGCDLIALRRGGG